jgi:alkylhydroperoxidase family enzyme
MSLLRRVFALAAMVVALSAAGCATVEQTRGDQEGLTESRIKPVAESAWTAEQRKVLGNYRLPDGRYPNILVTLANHPSLFDNYLAFVTRESTLPARDREILILRVGWLRRAEFVLGWHTLYARKAGLTDEEIARVAKGPLAPGWDAFDAALMAAADELVGSAFITDATWGALAARYNDRQLLDLVFMVGQYDMISMYLKSVGVPLDASVPHYPVMMK